MKITQTTPIWFKINLRAALAFLNDPTLTADHLVSHLTSLCAHANPLLRLTLTKRLPCTQLNNCTTDIPNIYAQMRATAPTAQVKV